jgi:L,D-peptidoglycan transpeptidase YkuD (ErfK/YbiS/YcfS/YnhG family)
MFPMQSPAALVLILMMATVPTNAIAADKVPSSLIRIPESVNTVFVAETSTARFHRFDRKGENLQLNGSYYMSIGRQGTGKQRSFDKRTPLGAYFVTEQLDTSQLHEKYGITAFPIDYPNAWDHRKNRDGDGIWVHGVDPENGQRPEFDTDGCIALSNEDLSSLAPLFQDNVTPVVIASVLNWADENDVMSLRVELETKVAAWASSRADGDLHAYLSLYDDEFERWGLKFPEWSSLIMQSGFLRPLQTATVSDLLLLAYPEEDGLYLSRFQLSRQDEGRQIVTTKRLYWRRDADGIPRIIAENEG